MKALLLVLGLCPASFGDVYEAIRRNDRAAAVAESQKLDAKGSTPLMHAAAIGSVEMMQALIEAGADVNARNGLNQTALHWAARDASKTKLLLDRGADVHAASRMERTPLIAAAAYAGNAETIRMLLAKGAKVTARDKTGATAFTEAARANDAAMVRLLRAAGAEINEAGSAGLAALHWAAANANAALVRWLLAEGAKADVISDPSFGPPVKNGPVALGALTPLHLAAPSGDAEIARMLLDAKAPVNARDVRGMTPLMLAIATDRPNRALVALLQQHGADPSIRDRNGETDADWARKFQSQSAAAAATNTARPAASANQAATRALALLEQASAVNLREGGCISCHGHNVLTVATAHAAAHGVSHDAAAASTRVRDTLAQFAGAREFLLERLDPPAPEILAYALFALAEAGVKPDRVTDAMAANLMAQQKADGSWSMQGVARPPMSSGPASMAALSIRAIREYAPPSMQAEAVRRIELARRVALGAQPTTTEDAVMQLLAAKWAPATDPAEVTRRERTLRLLQRKDGGWGQTPRLSSDAYATATAMYALREASQAAGKDPAIARGARFLIQTQLPDGSWKVASRSPKFQPYFDFGFPHGHDQWISQMATGWAAAALIPIPDPSPARAIARR
jgi:ankyrin repeat protein